MLAPPLQTGVAAGGDGTIVEDGDVGGDTPSRRASSRLGVWLHAPRRIDYVD